MASLSNTVSNFLGSVEDDAPCFVEVPKPKKFLTFSILEGCCFASVSVAILTSSTGGIESSSSSDWGSAVIDRAQNRQEAYHGRLDAYAILRHRFRHGSSTEKKMELHNLCVEALMVVLHFDLHHRPLWEI